MQPRPIGATLKGPSLRNGLVSGGGTSGFPFECRHAPEFSKPEIVHGRLDLVPRVHYEGSMAHNGFGYGRSAQKQHCGIRGGLDTNLAAAALEQQQLGITRLARTVGTQRA